MGYYLNFSLMAGCLGSADQWKWLSGETSKEAQEFSRQRKGVLQTWSVNKANSRESAPVSGNLSGSKGRRGGQGGWQCDRSWTQTCAPCFFISTTLLFFSLKLPRLLCPWFQRKLFQPSVVSLDCRVSSLSSSVFHLILHHDTFNENIIYLLFSCKSLVTLC